MYEYRRIFPFLALILPVGASAQYVPDQQLRGALNSIAPGLVDENGLITEPGYYIPYLGLSPDASMPPLDLTGLEYISCSTLSLDCLNGGSFGAFPAFPEIVGGVNTLIQLNHFNGPEVPPLPSGLEAFMFWYPQNVGTWYLNGHADDGVPLNVEVIGLPATMPWAQVTEHIDYLAITDYPRAQPPAIGPGVRTLQFWGADLMTGLPYLNNDLIGLGVQYCPALTAIDLAGQVDSLTYLTLEYVPALTSVTGIPEVYGDVWLHDVPSLQVATFDSIHGRLSVIGSPAEPFMHLPPGLMSVYLGIITPLHLSAFPSTLLDIEINGEIPALPEFPDGVDRIAVYPWNSDLCIPWLPASLTSVEVAGAACYPNQPPLVTTPLTLCTILNSYCPELSPTIAGHVFRDENGNGTQDPDETDAPNALILVQPSGRMTSTNASGDYRIGVLPGEHTVLASSDNAYFNIPIPASRTVSLPLQNSQVSNVDFVMESDGPIATDRKISILPITPAYAFWPRSFSLHWETTGYEPTPSTIGFSLMDESEEAFAFAEPSFQSLGNNLFTLPLNLDESFYGTATITTSISPFLGQGATALTTATITPVIGDPTPNDNTTSIEMEVVSSYDPNDKLVTPAVLTPAEVASDTAVIYTIRFQNTGTAPAFRVLITDTLSTDLQWETFRFMHSSHPSEWFMRDGVIHFLFNDIMLPDSTTDQAGSHGAVRFSIRPKTTLLLGDTVINTANIYFDFNEPVITAPCILTIDAVTSIAPLDAHSIMTYPSPASDQLTVTGISKGVVLDLISMDGRSVLRTVATGPEINMGVSGLARGSYVLSIQTVTDTIRKQVVLE